MYASKQPPLKSGDICLLEDLSLIKRSRDPLVKAIGATKSRTGEEIRTARLEAIADPLSNKNLKQSLQKFKYVQRDVRCVANLEISPDEDEAYS